MSIMRLALNYTARPLKRILMFGQTITDDFDIDALLNHADLEDCYYYKANKKNCPYLLGGWMLSIKYKDGSSAYFPLGQAATEERVKEYLKPILDLIKRY